MMWQSPKLFGVGQFVEMRLYSIVLTIAKSFGYITKVSHLLGLSLSARVSKMDILRKPLSMDI